MRKIRINEITLLLLYSLVTGFHVQLKLDYI